MTEHEIIKGCQKKKAKYQKELVFRYSPQLLTIARRYSRDNSAAKDVLQDAFILIFKNIENYRFSGSFKGWLSKVVVNVALQSKKKASYQREHAGIDNLPHPLTPPQILSKLNEEELITLIQGLPERYRDVFNLYVFEGYSHNEIGELLGISPGTSRSQLTRARQKLQMLIINLEKESYVRRVG